MVALYDNDWFIAQVEGEEPDEEVEGFTLLRYMEQKGENQFIHGKVDTLKTNDKDTILRVNHPSLCLTDIMDFVMMTLKS